MTSRDYWLRKLSIGLRLKKLEPYSDPPLTEDEIEDIKTFADKRIAVKILHYYKKSKDEIKEILGVDSDFVEEALKYNHRRSYYE